MNVRFFIWKLIYFTSLHFKILKSINVIDPGQMVVDNKDQPINQNLGQFQEMFLDNFGSGKYLTMFYRFHITKFLSIKHDQLINSSSLIVGLWFLTPPFSWRTPLYCLPSPIFILGWFVYTNNFLVIKQCKIHIKQSLPVIFLH